jgi:hypothetical protein
MADDVGSGSLGDPMLDRLMAMVVGLAGELFVLKAQHERLTRLLLSESIVTEEALEAMADDEALRDWMESERLEFGRWLLDPIQDPESR